MSTSHELFTFFFFQHAALVQRVDRCFGMATSDDTPFPQVHKVVIHPGSLVCCVYFSLVNVHSQWIARFAEYTS